LLGNLLISASCVGNLPTKSTKLTELEKSYLLDCWNLPTYNGVKVLLALKTDLPNKYWQFA
jgi:hypothetical protein